ncbi:restriction modification system DNA specificity domain-containing protein [Calothrix sp. NIES-4071]|nr:restriction modification system DNA specificity domain-containing protein [Calothrix sp. NIES-4071]BAZ54364.1 restriction modification system DNA specificity domain-containing protein [Calothrix sp. NIES-4105]
MPEGWLWTTIGEIAQSMQNGIYKPSQFYSDDGIACLRMYNIENGEIVWKDIKRMILTPEEIRQYKLEANDILINRVNSRELVGKAAPIPFDIEICVYESKNIRLRFFNNLIESKLIGFWFRIYSQKYFNQNAQQTVGMASINQEQIGLMPIPLPPLNEQRRLVAKIESLKARTARVKESLSTIPALLDQFRQSVLAAAFRGALTADWRRLNPNVEPASVLLESIQKGKQEADAKAQRKPAVKPNIPLPDNLQFPKSWEIVISHDLFLFVTSGSRGWAQYYSDDGAIFIRVGNLNRNTISLDFTSVQRVNPSVGTEGTRTRVKPKDILISITADIGMVAVIPEDIPEAYINQHVALARPQEYLLSEYFGWYIASSECGFKQLKELQRGMTKIGLGLDDIRSIWIPLPPVEEQKEIIRKIHYFFKIADTIEQQYQQTFGAIDQLDQTILAQAFRGALVPQDPNDEPASVLLERIRAEREKNAGATSKRSKKNTDTFPSQNNKNTGASSKRSNKSTPFKEAVQMELELE